MASDSLFNGASGLTADQSRIDVISNNIANAGTAGCEGQGLAVQEPMCRSAGFALAPAIPTHEHVMTVIQFKR